MGEAGCCPSNVAGPSPAAAIASVAPQQLLQLDAADFVLHVKDVVEEFLSAEFDHWEEYLKQQMADDKRWPVEQKAIMKQVVDHVYEATCQQLKQRLAEFERFAMAVPFHVPAGLMPEQEAAPGGETVTEEQECSANAQLLQLRQQLIKQRHDNDKLRWQLAELDSELATYGVPPPGLQHAAAALGDKENVEAVSSLYAAARRLAAQLGKAQGLMESHALLTAPNARSASLTADKEIARRQAAIAATPLDQLLRLQAQLKA